jgi:hypothetical protein
MHAIAAKKSAAIEAFLPGSLLTWLWLAGNRGRSRITSGMDGIKRLEGLGGAERIQVVSGARQEES